MSFRVETRFRLARYRELPGFLWGALVLVAEFRRSSGGRAMWLKGRPWDLVFGSYSEWRDEASMRQFAASAGHRQGMRTIHVVRACETWTMYNDGRAAYFQKCGACGEMTRGSRRQASCPGCQALLPLTLGPLPARPSRGLPISPRIPPSRAIRIGNLGALERPACERCGQANSAGTAYCVHCGARTYHALGFVTGIGWWSVIFAIVFLVLSCIAIAIYLVAHWR